MLRIWEHHAITNRWGDIGYHYLIDPRGVIYEGRAGGIDVIGAHVRHHNRRTAGIAFLETFCEIEPTPAALRSAERLIAWICCQRNIDPLGSGPDFTGRRYNFIAGHRDLAATACPGDRLYGLLPIIRQNVFEILKPPPAPPFNFSISVSPASGTVEQGRSISATVTATLVSGTTQRVNLTTGQLPPGVSVTFRPTGGNPTFSSTMTISTTAAAPARDHRITIIGTGGGITRTATYTLTVRSPFDFRLSVSPPSGTVEQGRSTSATVTATLLSGTTQRVNLTTGPLPPGVSVTFRPTGGNPTFSSAMTISTTARTPEGRYPITVTGTGGGLTRTAVYTLNVTEVPLPLPTISYSPSSFSFTATEGGPNPPSQVLEIWNAGGGTLNWFVSDDADWLTLMPTMGSSGGEHSLVTVSVDIWGMSAGDYSTIITISAPDATNTPQTVPVSLSITMPVIDRVAPTYEWIARPETGTTGESVLVKVRATDNIGITLYNIAVDGVEYVMTRNGDYYTYTINIPLTSTAPIVYHCTFGDAAGNRITTQTITITVTDIPIPAPIFAFDTGKGTYPSIMGTHYGTITPNSDITVSKLYTYPCEGTGGHTEYVWIHGHGINVSATWTGYGGDWRNVTFDSPFTLKAGKTYFYEIRTGSYPQIHHTAALLTANGWINCTKFIDANGKIYYDWIPAIRLE